VSRCVEWGEIRLRNDFIYQEYLEPKPYRYEKFQKHSD
jgi:hypothetical protein